MKKPLGLILLLAYIAIYIGFVATVGAALTTSSRLLQLIFYVVVGFAWILPLKPFFRWMNSGSDSANDG